MSLKGWRLITREDPKGVGPVLGWAPSWGRADLIHRGWYGKWFLADDRQCYPTHWRPLPAPPKDSDVQASPLHPDAPPVPPGLRPRDGVEYGCGKADCTGCYEPEHPDTDDHRAGCVSCQLAHDQALPDD